VVEPFAGPVPVPGSPQRELRRLVGRASAFNVAATAASAVAGLLAARYLGPAVKGQFAAVTSWFGSALILGELGQQAAIVYYVAHEPGRARDYVVTSRNIMLATGTAVAVVGVLLAPALSHGVADETLAYRALFVTCPLAFVSSSFMFSLQARSIHRWIVLRAVQPVGYLLLTLTLIGSHRLTLGTAAASVVVSIVVQAVMSWAYCAREGLVGGRHDWRLGRNVVGYGLSQMLSTTPTQVNVNLDQLVLSQTVAASSLGQYSLAAALTSLAIPFVAPIGSVLFPRLAAGRDSNVAARRLQWVAVAVTAAFSAVVMVVLAATAGALLPAVFGSGYRPSVELVWIMAPAGVFFSVNQVVGDLLRGRGKPLTVALAQLAGAALTAGMLIVLIPRYGAAGAAITTSVAYGVITLILLIVLRRPTTVAKAQPAGSDTPLAL